MTIHMSFEQLDGKHLRAAAMTHGSVVSFLFILDLLVMVAGLWFHLVPLCRSFTTRQGHAAIDMPNTKDPLDVCQHVEINGIATIEVLS
jgi:hypothetical protein